MPERSSAHALGAELRRQRLEAGHSQAALGELVHHSGALLGKVEKAERFPSAELCGLLDRALGTGGILAMMRAHAERHRDSEHLCFVEPAWTLESSLRALRELTGGRVDRRDFLALTGAALTATATSWSTAGTADGVAASASARRLGSATVARLATRLADLRALDDEMGGTVLRELAGAELRWLRDLASSADLTGLDRQRVLGLVTEAARLCGWMHLDAGHEAAAQAHYVTALRCSAAAADSLMGANVLAGMSFQAMLADHPVEALSLLDTAEQRVRRDATPTLRALLASRRARAHARAGDTRACGLALAAAETALDAADPGRGEPDWVYFFDEAELNAQAGACWVDLARPDKARPLLDDALRTMGPQYVRDRTIYHVRSAQTYYAAGELPTACEELTAAATLVGRTGSVRSITTIRGARRAMAAHDAEPVVRDFDRTFALALASAA